MNYAKGIVTCVAALVVQFVAIGAERIDDLFTGSGSYMAAAVVPDTVTTNGVTKRRLGVLTRNDMVVTDVSGVKLGVDESLAAIGSLATNALDAAILAGVTASNNAIRVDEVWTTVTNNEDRSAVMWIVLTNNCQYATNIWITLDSYIEYFEDYAHSNQWAALLANYRAKRLEIWQKAISNDVLLASATNGLKSSVYFSTTNAQLLTTVDTRLSPTNDSFYRAVVAVTTNGLSLTSVTNSTGGRVTASDVGAVTDSIDAMLSDTEFIGAVDALISVHDSQVISREKSAAKKAAAAAHPVRIGPYLWEMTADNDDFVAATNRLRTVYPSYGRCTGVCTTRYHGRNLDYNYDSNATVVVRSPARPGKLGVLGIASSAISDAVLASGEWVDTYYSLPFTFSDGINECGVVIQQNVVTKSDDSGSWPVDWHVRRDGSVILFAVIRYTLDRCRTASEAAAMLRDITFIPEEFPFDSHFLVSDRTSSYIVEDGRVLTAGELPRSDAITNFRLRGVQLNGDGSLKWGSVETYGIGLERYGTVLASDFTTYDGMYRLMKSLWYTKAYVETTTPYWLTEHCAPGHTPDFSVQNTIDHPEYFWDEKESWYADYVAEHTEGGPRYRGGVTWHTVHTAVYDKDNLAVWLTVQEDESSTRLFGLSGNADRFMKNIKATADIGIHKVDKSTGYVELDLAGKTIEDGIKYIVAETKPPQRPTYPKITQVALSSVGEKEVGTVFTPSYTVKADTGAHTFGGATGVVYDEFVIYDTANRTNRVTGTSAEALTQTGSFGSFVVRDDTSYRIYAKAHHKQGDLQRNNQGVVDTREALRIAERWCQDKETESAATVYDSGAEYVTGYRPWYVYTGKSTAAVDAFFVTNTSSKVVSDGVVLSAKSLPSSYVITIPEGETRIAIAIPSYKAGVYTKTVSGIIDKTGMLAQVLDNFTKYTVAINVAGLTQNYDVWCYDKADGFPDRQFEVSFEPATAAAYVPGSLKVSAMAAEQSSSEGVGTPVVPPYYQNAMPMLVGLKRTESSPLDSSSVFYSKADMDYYVSTGGVKTGTSAHWRNQSKVYPYSGQIVTLAVPGSTPTNYILSSKADGTFATEALATKGYVDASKPEDYESVSSKALSALQADDITDDVTSTATDKALSANMGRELQDQITNLKQRGRYLSVWNSATGKPMTNPVVTPYYYKAGDYYIVGIVTNGTGATNYMPEGTNYTGAASTEVESDDGLKVNDTYYFDGEAWTLLSGEQKEITIAGVVGLSEALSGTNSWKNGGNITGSLSVRGAQVHTTDSDILIGKDSAPRAVVFYSGSDVATTVYGYDAGKIYIHNGNVNGEKSTLTVDGSQVLTETLGDTRYLGKTSKASDSDKLDGHDSSYFAPAVNGGYATPSSVSDAVAVKADAFVEHPTLFTADEGRIAVYSKTDDMSGATNVVYNGNNVEFRVGGDIVNGYYVSFDVDRSSLVVRAMAPDGDHLDPTKAFFMVKTNTVTIAVKGNLEYLSYPVSRTALPTYRNGSKVVDSDKLDGYDAVNFLRKTGDYGNVKLYGDIECYKVKSDILARKVGLSENTYIEESPLTGNSAAGESRYGFKFRSYYPSSKVSKLHPDGSNVATSNMVDRIVASKGYATAGSITASLAGKADSAIYGEPVVFTGNYNGRGPGSFKVYAKSADLSTAYKVTCLSAVATNMACSADGSYIEFTSDTATASVWLPGEAFSHFSYCRVYPEAMCCIFSADGRSYYIVQVSSAAAASLDADCLGGHGPNYFSRADSVTGTYDRYTLCFTEFDEYGTHTIKFADVYVGGQDNLVVSFTDRMPIDALRGRTLSLYDMMHEFIKSGNTYSIGNTSTGPFVKYNLVGDYILEIQVPGFSGFLDRQDMSIYHYTGSSTSSGNIRFTYQKSSGAVQEECNRYADAAVLGAVGVNPSIVTNIAEDVYDRNLPLKMQSVQRSVSTLADRTVFHYNVTEALTINFVRTQAVNSAVSRCLEVYLHCDLDTPPQVTWNKGDHKWFIPEDIEGRTMDPIKGDKIIYFNEIAPNTWMVQPSELKEMLPNTAQ